MSTGKVLGVVAGVGLAALLIAVNAKPTSATGLAELSGQVLDDYGRPVSGVTVNLSGLITTTDADGRYQYTGLQPGIYMISFTKEGYESRAN
jgi:protocatechuate 3,4-dioxygenase beta subunit